MFAALGCIDGCLWSRKEGGNMAKNLIGVYAFMITAVWIIAVYKLFPVVMTIVFNFKRFMG